MQEKKQPEDATTIVDEMDNVSSVEVETKDQKEKIKAGVVNAMKATFTEDVINSYLRKYSPSERRARQESLRNDLGELATKLKGMAAEGDLKLENKQITEAVICDFLGSKRLSSLTSIIKGEEVGLAEEDFLEKATEDELNIPLSGEQYGMGDESKKSANETAKGGSEKIVSEKDFFEKTKTNPDKIYVNSAGKKMKVVSYKNGKVQIAFLPNGTKVEDGVNVISLDSEWNSDADGKEVGVAEFLAMMVDYDEMPDGTSKDSGEKVKKNETAEKVDSMEVADAKKEKGEVLSLKDLTELFGVAGSVHATEDGAKKLEILNYLYKKDETKWEIEVKESETGEKKMLSPDDLQDLIATKYTKIDLIPEVEAGGMKSAEFVAEFGKSGEFVFKSDLGGLKSFVIEKDKFSEQSKQHMVKIRSAGEDAGRYISVKELRQMISNGVYRKEPNSNEEPKTEKKDDDEGSKGGAETGINYEEPNSKDASGTEKKEEKKEKDEESKELGKKTGTHFEERMKKTENLKEEPGKNKDSKEMGGKTGTHFEEWMKKTENFKEEPGKNIEGLKGVDLAVLQDEFSQLSEIRNSLLSKKDRTDQENSQLQEVELSLSKYKEEIEGRGESVVEIEPLNIDDIVGDDETEKNPENQKNKKEEEPKIQTEKEKRREEQRKMDEKFNTWKESQVNFEKKGNELGIVKRNLAKMGIDFGEDAEVMKELHNAKKAMEAAEKDFKNAHIEFVAPLAKKNKAALEHSKVKGLEKNEMMRKYLFAEKLIEKKSVDENGNEKIEELSLMEDLGNKMLELNQARKEALAEREQGIVEKLFAKYQKVPKKKKLLIATALAGALGAGGALFAGAAVGTVIGAAALSGGTRLVRSLIGGAAGAFAFKTVSESRESSRKKRSENIEGKTINRTLRGAELDMVSMVQKKAGLERNDNIKAMAAAGITGIVLGGGMRVVLDWPDVPSANAEVSTAAAKSVENPKPIDHEGINDNPETKGFSKEETFKRHQERFTNAKYQEFLNANGGETLENKKAWLKLKEDSRNEVIRIAALENEAEKQSSASEKTNLDPVGERASAEKIQAESYKNPVTSETENSNETISSNNQPETILTEDPKVLADRQLSEKLKELKIDENHEVWKALRGMKLGQIGFLPRSGEEAINAFRDRTLRLPPEVSANLGTLDIREAKKIGQIMGAVFGEVDQSAVGNGNIKLEDALRGDYEPKSTGAGFSNKPLGPPNFNTFPEADEEYLKTVIHEEPPSSSEQEAPVDKQKIVADKQKVVFDIEDRAFIEKGEGIDPRVLEEIKGKDFNIKLKNVESYVKTEIEVNKNPEIEYEFYGRYSRAMAIVNQIEKQFGLGEQSLQESLDKYIAAGNKLDASEMEEMQRFVKYVEDFEDKNSISKDETIPKTSEVDLRVFENIKIKDFKARLDGVSSYVKTEIEVNKNPELEYEFYGLHSEGIAAIDKINGKVGIGDQSLRDSIDKYLAIGNKLEPSEIKGIEKLVKYVEEFKTV